MRPAHVVPELLRSFGCVHSRVEIAVAVGHDRERCTFSGERIVSPGRLSLPVRLSGWFNLRRV